MYIRVFFLSFFISSLVIFSYQSLACTRILLNKHHDAILVGRTMDWSDEEMNTKFFVYPRGMLRKGSNSGNTLQWQSKYGSIVTTAYDNYTTDGMNEKGLAAHILSLKESDYGTRNEALPSLSLMMWAQFYLDNFSTVDEAVNYTKQTAFQILPFYLPKLQHWIKLHLALEDASGDSVIIEYIKGEVHIYHHASYKVLTNSPTYDKHLKYLQAYQSKQTDSDDHPLPGTTNSPDRFIRAHFYSTRMPRTAKTREAISQMQSVINNVAQPYGKETVQRDDISPTLWRVISDLTNKVYYFNLSTHLNTIWITLNKFNLQPGSSVMEYSPSENEDIAGDISTKFHPI